MSHPAHWTLAQCAAYDLVHDYREGNRRGAAALARHLNKAANVISNEANPDYLGAKLGLEDALHIEQLSQDPRLLMAHAHSLGYTVLALPESPAAGDVELLNHFSEWQAAMGETCRRIHDALADGEITAEEAREVAAAGQHHMTRFMAFLERLESMAEPAPHG